MVVIVQSSERATLGYSTIQYREAKVLSLGLNTQHTRTPKHSTYHSTRPIAQSRFQFGHTVRPNTRSNQRRGFLFRVSPFRSAAIYRPLPLTILRGGLVFEFIANILMLRLQRCFLHWQLDLQHPLFTRIIHPKTTPHCLPDLVSKF